MSARHLLMLLLGWGLLSQSGCNNSDSGSAGVSAPSHAPVTSEHRLQDEEPFLRVTRPEVDVADGLRTCYEFVEVEDRVVKELEALRDGLPTIQITNEKHSLQWMQVTLNQSGARFDAIRFRSPYESGSEFSLLSAIVCDGMSVSSFGVRPIKRRLQGSPHYSLPRHHVKLEPLDLQDENFFTFFFAHAMIWPQQDYYLFFTFTDEKPVTIYLRPLITYNAGIDVNSPLTLAQLLDIPYPIEHNASATVADLARSLKWDEGALAAADMLDNEIDGGLRDPRALKLFIEVGQVAAMQLVGQQQKELGFRMLVRVAEAAQFLEQSKEELKEAERTAVATAYYNAACAQSLQEQTDEAMKWLQAAVDAGFTNLNSIVADPDLDNLRELPAYERLLRELTP